MQDFEVSLAIGDAQRLRIETTLKHCLICHVLFGFRYILNRKEKSVLAILLTILFVCVN